MAASTKLDELLVNWLGADDVFEKILNLIESHRSAAQNSTFKQHPLIKTPASLKPTRILEEGEDHDPHKTSEHVPSIPDNSPESLSPRNVIIPPFYTPNEGGRGRGKPSMDQCWSVIFPSVKFIFEELASEQVDPLIPGKESTRFLSPKDFVRVTKEICGFPSFFSGPLYRRILQIGGSEQDEVITMNILKKYWEEEMEKYDAQDRFFRLVKRVDREYISRDDFLPFIEELLVCHPGLEFLLNHAEFQEKYAITVITRIFYSVNTCHNGKITARQIRKSDLLSVFNAVDDEEDINKITRYFSYEHFYVLYCRFWELDHDRDYRITREDLLKYGEHSLSHLIVDRIFEAAPRPFGVSTNATEEVVHSNDYLSYEDFIFFMLSEEDKANEISVRYWFACIDVDGDGRLNYMEMRSFYIVQLHRMHSLGHEVVPFEDMLCQMIDMIKPKNNDYFIVEDFLQPECAQVSGALFDALFNLNKYLQFEQRDPFMERQKREDEFDSDWDRFACIDYNRLAMEEEAREEEAMEIDWVTVDDDEDDEAGFGGLGGASEAPF